MFYNLIPKYTDIFCWKKWEQLLQCKSFSHFSNKKYWHVWNINAWNFNDTLTNDVVSFEQPGPDRYLWRVFCVRKKCSFTRFLLVPAFFFSCITWNATCPSHCATPFFAALLRGNIQIIIGPIRYYYYYYYWCCYCCERGLARRRI